jgi:hypothetical protein
MGGGALVFASTGIENSEAGLPISVAMACSYWVRAILLLMAADCALAKVVCACTSEI